MVGPSQRQSVQTATYLYRRLLHPQVRSQAGRGNARDEFKRLSARGQIPSPREAAEIIIAFRPSDVADVDRLWPTIQTSSEAYDID